jgi:DNA-binding PadR family transcriptional regulator
MTGIMSVPDRAGKTRGFITIYLLHTLSKKPKSGYEILSEIKEKCEGKWTPSKGTVYPLLAHLSAEGLLSVKAVGKRSKNTFEITSKGKDVLSRMHKEGAAHRERFMKFRILFSDMMGEEKGEIFKLLFELERSATAKTVKNRPKTVKMLKKCLIELEKID